MIVSFKITITTFPVDSLSTEEVRSEVGSKTMKMMAHKETLTRKNKEGKPIALLRLLHLLHQRKFKFLI
jgi:hypothetical protein